MYAPFFGLRQDAFSIAPDPRFLHLSTMHREALAHLIYGLQGGGGFVLLTGEIGTGKTTVCRCFLEQIPPGHRVAYVYNPQLTAVELLQTVCQEFGITLPDPAPTSVKPWIDALNEHLLRAHAAGEQCLLVIDEAQALTAELLEQLRLLTNLETNQRKLLQIVLIGQPELRRQLAQPNLEQLAQRVIARVHLGPLTASETADYVGHRLAVAGLSGPLPFTSRALTAVHRLSGGVPRRINLLCQRALLGAYAQGRRQVGTDVVRQAAHEAFGDDPARPQRLIAWASLGTGLLAAAVLAVVLGTGPGWLQQADQGARAASQAAAAASTATGGTTPLLDQPRPFADAAAGWTALAGLWSVTLVEGTDACDQARNLDLLCHEGNASLELLRQLQRPVLLHLGPDRAPVLLLAIGPDLALLSGSGGEHRVSLPTLQAAWAGGFSTWWRPPPGWGGGASTAVVGDWVLQRLTALQGEARTGAGRRNRDDELRQRVFAFQVAQGLALDGLAGPITLMQLNRVSGVDEPRLRRNP